MLLQAEGSAQMSETTAQVAGLYQGAQRYCDILQFFLKLVFLMEIYWNVLGKFYFVRGNFVQKRYQSTWSFKIFQYAIYYQFLIK